MIRDLGEQNLILLEQGRKAARVKEPLHCPYCQEERQVEVDGYVGYCNVCGRMFAVPLRSKTPDRPIVG